jgi:hypothetical protein
MNWAHNKPRHKHWVLTGVKLDDIGARREHTPKKSLKRLAQDTGVLKSLMQNALHDPASRVYFCRWFLQFVIVGEIIPQLTETAFSTLPVIFNYFFLNVTSQQAY